MGRRLGDAVLGDHDADQVVWRDVERRVEALDPGRGHPDSGHAEHLVLVPFLDDDVLAPLDGQVDRGGRRGNNEGDARPLTGQRQTHRTHLVRRITIGSNAISADDRDIDQPSQDRARCRAVSLHDVLDPVVQELPARQPGALEQWPCLVGVHQTQPSALVQLVDDSVCRAPRAGGQSPRVAVCDDPHLVLGHVGEDPVGAVLGELPVRGLVVGHDLPCQSEHCGYPGRNGCSDLVHAPCEVDRRGPGITNPVDLALQPCRIPVLIISLGHGKGDTEGPSRTQSRRTSDHQVPDRLDQDVDSRDVDVLLGTWQQGLVDEPDRRSRIVQPLNREHHRVSSFAAEEDAATGRCASCHASVSHDVRVRLRRLQC